jgi:hypothetical protein
LKDSIVQLLSVLPSEPIAIGDSWEHELDLKSEPTMPMKISAKYTLKDVRDGVAYVKYDAKITSTADLKGTIEGDAEIDQETGLTSKFVAKLKAEGKQAGADFKLDAETTVKAE